MYAILTKNRKIRMFWNSFNSNGVRVCQGAPINSRQIKKMAFMRLSTALSLASSVIRKRKFKLLVVGIQLAYVGYKYISSTNKGNRKR